MAVVKTRTDYANVVACTGHRPDKLGGWDNAAAEAVLDAVAAAFFQRLQPDRVIVGMAPGFDFACARAAKALAIPYIAAIPFTKQPERWSARYRREWSELCVSAGEVHIVTPDGMMGESYGAVAGAMQRRNRWMVDRANRVLALWDGSDGGTANTVEYARSVGVPVIYAWPEYEEARGRRRS